MTDRELVNFSNSQHQKIHCYRWLAQDPKGIVHLAHGMGEHAERYEWTAQQLVKAGYHVYANDHQGHGHTTARLGDFGSDGWNTMVNDLHELIEDHKQAYPGLPTILFGHSMGSMLSQQFVTRYGDSIDALVLSGSPGFASNLYLWLNRLICRFENWRLPPLTESKLLSFLLFGAANKPFESKQEPGTGFEWLSRDPEQVSAYVDDALCGFVPFPASLVDMTVGVTDTQRATSIANIPKSLPIYLFSGTQDPVHQKMKNIERMIQDWSEIGISTTSRFYEGGRHEMLNETNREEVISEAIDWLGHVLGRPNAVTS
ncbi:MAG: lysophospholipase [Pseudomonadales bacterium]|nr:lysophospholipase [Pseudomonadales bacterium]